MERTLLLLWVYFDGKSSTESRESYSWVWVSDVRVVLLYLN